MKSPLIIGKRLSDSSGSLFLCLVFSGLENRNECYIILAYVTAFAFSQVIKWIQNRIPKGRSGTAT